MTEPANGSAARLALGPRLHQLRKDSGLTMTDVSQQLEAMSPSKLSRIERGEGRVRILDLEQLCKLYGLTDQDKIRELTELAKASRAQSWLRSYADVVSANFRRYIDLEAQAAAFSWYEMTYVPGLLQTRDFARGFMAIQRRTGFELTDDALERRLEVRLKRQEILTRPSPPTLDVILNESVLEVEGGGPKIMAGQLGHFLEMAEMPNVNIRVMPADREHAGIATGQFVLLDFVRGATVEFPPSVYVDGYLGFYLTDKPDEVELFRTSWADMSSVALSSRKSADVIARRVKELRQQA